MEGSVVCREATMECEEGHIGSFSAVQMLGCFGLSGE